MPEKKPHVANNSGNNEWFTPCDYIESARKVMGSIDLDPASHDEAQKVVQASTYYTKETNGLDKKWGGNIWLNPPYAAALISKFADKLVSEYWSGNVTQAIVLVNNATETAWFGKLVGIASAVIFPKGRVKFYSPDGRIAAPLQGQAVLYIGSHRLEFLKEFGKFGWGGYI